MSDNQSNEERKELPGFRVEYDPRTTRAVGESWVYRLSKYKDKLPITHRFDRVSKDRPARIGFEAYKGVCALLADTIVPDTDSPGAGNFTPGAGYHWIFLIRVKAKCAHDWFPDRWVIVIPDDTDCVRTIEASKVHTRLIEEIGKVEPLCKEYRTKVYNWAQNHKDEVERWLHDKSTSIQHTFIDTLADQINESCHHIDQADD